MTRPHDSSRHRPSRRPIDVEVTEIGSEPFDANLEASPRRGVYLGFGVPWLSFRAYIGQGDGLTLSAGFKVNVRLLPGRPPNGAHRPDPFARMDPWG